MDRRTWFLALALAAPGLARAQAVQRTVRIVAGFPPGGQIDAVARLLAEALRRTEVAALVGSSLRQRRLPARPRQSCAVGQIEGRRNAWPVVH
jgi:hypothetical protein